MGDSDEGVALSVLMRSLEGFHHHGVPVNAVVLGKMGNPPRSSEEASEDSEAP